MSKSKNSGKTIPLRRRNNEIRSRSNGDPVSLLNGLTSTEEVLFKLLEGIGDFEQTLKPPKFFRTIIFGSARVEPETPVYEETRRLARELARRGVNIVTGGGPGLMEAANRGAMEGRNHKALSFGVCIEQLNRNEKPNEYLRRAYRHRHFCTRLHQFARLGGSGAFVVMPGGVGTTLELALILQLLQVGHLRDVPLIAIGEMWSEYKHWALRSMTPAYANATELERLQVVATVDEALPIVIEAHQRFKARRAA